MNEQHYAASPHPAKQNKTSWKQSFTDCIESTYQCQRALLMRIYLRPVSEISCQIITTSPTNAARNICYLTIYQKVKSRQLCNCTYKTSELIMAVILGCDSCTSSTIPTKVVRKPLSRSRLKPKHWNLLNELR